jgi:CARDB
MFKNIATLLALTLLPVSLIFAQAEEDVVVTSTEEKEQVSEETPIPTEDSFEFAIVAEVSVRDGLVVEQRGADFIIEFALENEGKIEPEVLYGVRVFKPSEFGPALVDEYVYPEVLSLDTGEKVAKQITYTAPFALHGEYVLQLVAANKSGLEYGAQTLGTYSIDTGGLAGSITITPEECSVGIEMVNGERVTYGFFEGIDLDSKTEKFFLSCDTLTGIPDMYSADYEVRERSAFGDVVGAGSVDWGSYTLEDGSFFMYIPTPEKPQSYLTYVVFKNPEGTEVSNPITFRFVVQGESATVQNISLDKRAYTAGETAQVSVFTSGYADIFEGARGREMQTEEASAESLMVQVVLMSNGKACSAVQTKSLSEDGTNGFLDLSIPVIEDCPNPTAEVEILSQSGATLAQDSAKVGEGDDVMMQEEASTNETDGLYAAVFIILLLGGLVGYYLYTQLKKNDTHNTPSPPTVALFLMVLIGGMVGGGIDIGIVQADSFSVVTGSRPNQNTFTGYYNLSSSAVLCGQNVVADISTHIAGCSNSVPSSRMYINGVEVGYGRFFSGRNVSMNYWIGPFYRQIVAPTSNGSFDYRFVFGYQRNSSVLNRSKSYTVGSCATTFTPTFSNSGACATAGNPSQNGSVAMSITNVFSPVNPVTSYGFKCGAQTWVYKNTVSHTCSFDAPGTYTLQYAVRSSAGTVLATQSRTVTITECLPPLPTCAVSFSPSTLSVSSSGSVIISQTNDADGRVSCSCSGTLEGSNTVSLASGTYPQGPYPTSGTKSCTCTVANAAGSRTCSGSLTVPAPAVCSGSIPPNASAYDAEESSSLLSSSAWAYSASDTSTKCQYRCNGTHVWNGSSCVAITDLTSNIAPTVSGTLIQGSNVTFGGQVRNSGTASISADWDDEFTYRWGTSGAWIQIGADIRKTAILSVGGTANDTSASFNLSNTGTLQVQHCVDASLEIAESNESDNCRTATFTVSAPATYTCSGSPVAYASYYSGDNTSLVGPASATYSSTNTATKCEYFCNSSHTWDGSSCASTLSVTLSPNPSPGRVGSEVRWNAKASGGTGPGTYTFSWSGDVTSATGFQGNTTSDNYRPETYSTTGNKTVTVTVTDTGGGSKPMTASVTIDDGLPQ